MRLETKRLLDRLGQGDFNYREYNNLEEASESHRWPLFELADRQLQQRAEQAAKQAPVAEAEQAPQANDIKSLVNRLAESRQS